MKRYNH